MPNTVSKVTVYSTEIDDRPGSAAQVFRALADSGADLRFVLARRQPDKPGKGILFVAPIRGKKQEEAAHAVSLFPASDLVAVRVEGQNKSGLGHRMTQALADAGINLRGLSAIVSGAKFVALFAFDNTTDADRGLKELRKVT